MINFNLIEIGLPNVIDFIKLRIWLKEVIIEEGKTVGDIDYQFCSDNYLHKINIDFLDHDTLTDIITFPTSDNFDIVSGEIYISIDRVIDNSKDLTTAFVIEFCRVLVHGVLHLMGFDDKTKEQSSMMRIKEDYYLQKFENI